MIPLTAATRINVRSAAVTLASDTPNVAGWCAQYFGGWWHSQDVEPDAHGTSSVDHRLVVARIDDRRYARIRDQVRQGPHQRVEFAKAAVYTASSRISR